MISSRAFNHLQICCFPSNLLGKKAVLSEEMATLTSNSSDAFLHNLTHLRNQRDNTPTNSNNSGKNEEIVLLEKQGRSSQKLRSNLAQVSSTIGHNMSDISNICLSSGSSKVCLKVFMNHQLLSKLTFLSLIKASENCFTSTKRSTIISTTFSIAPSTTQFKTTA
jgi:hypothetical protein